MGQFFRELVQIGLRAVLIYVLAFAIGTGGGAIFCWYYGLPLGLSLLGGVAVLGLALALMSDTIFD